MEQFIEFAGNHLVLVAALVVISALLLQNVLADLGGSGALGPQSATGLINHEEAVVVDLRPMADYAKGHIIHAINIPMNGFTKQIQQLEKHREKPIILSCRSGAQSSLAYKQLRKSGFERAYTLKGGIMAWQSANLPISRK